MKEKTITDEDLSALEYLGSVSGTGLQNAIKTLCTKKAITKKFMQEYKNYVDKNIFSTAVGLNYELIQAYPDLFDIEIWKAYPKRSLECLKSQEFLDMLSDEDLVEIVRTTDSYNITKDIFLSIFSRNSDDVRTMLFSKRLPFDFDKKFLLQNIRYLSDASFKNPHITDIMTTADIEKFFKVSILTMPTFISAVSCKNDIRWQLRMYESANDGKYTISNYTGTMDELIEEQILKLNDVVLAELFKVIEAYAPNALSFSVLQYALQRRDLDEDTCLILLPYFKKYNLSKALCEYAVDKGYGSILVGLI